MMKIFSLLVFFCFFANAKPIDNQINLINANAVISKFPTYSSVSEKVKSSLTVQLPQEYYITGRAKVDVGLVYWFDGVMKDHQVVRKYELVSSKSFEFVFSQKNKRRFDVYVPYKPFSPPTKDVNVFAEGFQMVYKLSFGTESPMKTLHGSLASGLFSLPKKRSIWAASVSWMFTMFGGKQSGVSDEDVAKFLGEIGENEYYLPAFKTVLEYDLETRKALIALGKRIGENYYADTETQTDEPARTDFGTDPDDDMRVASVGIQAEPNFSTVGIQAVPRYETVGMQTTPPREESVGIQVSPRTDSVGIQAVPRTQTVGVQYYPEDFGYETVSTSSQTELDEAVDPISAFFWVAKVLGINYEEWKAFIAQKVNIDKVKQDLNKYKNLQSLFPGFPTLASQEMHKLNKALQFLKLINANQPLNEWLISVGKRWPQEVKKIGGANQESLMISSEPLLNLFNNIL